MYLTRMKLDTGKRNTMKALSNPNLLHGAIEAGFSGERQHPLWRIDTLYGQNYLMLLSEEIPDLSAAAEQFGDASAPVETRDYTPLCNRIKTGTRWHFRLTANPTYSEGGNIEEGKRGAVHAHRVPKYQRQWLLKQSEKHGFCIHDDDFEVVRNQWFCFFKGEKRNRVSLLSVTYEGYLTVTEPEAFVQLLCYGIGRGKAYGMGLLTVVRCHE